MNDRELSRLREAIKTLRGAGFTNMIVALDDLDPVVALAEQAEAMRQGLVKIERQECGADSLFADGIREGLETCAAIARAALREDQESEGHTHDWIAEGSTGQDVCRECGSIRESEGRGG